MTSGLRKAHKYIWLLLAIAIPVLILFSIKDLDVSSSEIASYKFEASKSNVLKVAENELIKASLHSNSIEVILKSTLKNPSSILYAMDSNGNKDAVIGHITSSGIYNFEIADQPKGILLYDALKKEIITKLIL